MSTPYDPRDFPPFAVTVDIAVFALSDDGLTVLLVERGVDPFAGRLALPGGFVGADESVDDAAWRELQEETGISASEIPGVHLEQLATFGAVDRDPRMRVVSIAYAALSPCRPSPIAGTDAAGASWVPVADVRPKQLAFDHAEIFRVALERVRSKLEYTTLATKLAGPEFTLGELQRVYEATWDTELERANFRRKVLATPGFVKPTRKRRPSHGGGPPATVYRAGGGDVLDPPMMRPSD